MMQKQSNNKRSLLIPILTLLFFVSLLYAAYDEYGPFELKEEVTTTKENIPEYFDYGSIADSSYCNDFFEFRIPILKGHEADYKIYDYTNSNIHQRDSVLAKPRLVSTIGEHDLLIITPELVKIDLMKIFKETGSFEDWQNYSSKKLKRESFGPDYSLIIKAHNLSGKPVGAYTSQFLNIHNLDYGNSKTKMISSISFQEYQGMESRDGSMQEAMFGIMGGKNKKITSYVTKIHGFALNINLFYQTEEQKCALLAMIARISFH